MPEFTTPKTHDFSAAAHHFAMARDIILHFSRREKQHDGYYSVTFTHLPNLEAIPPEITECKWVHHLDLSGTKVSDLRPLAGLDPLRQLVLARTPVSDLKPLEGSLLRTLKCDDSGIDSIDALKGLTRLRKLSISGTQVRDFSVLPGLSLTELDISRTNIIDLSPVAKSRFLRELIMHHTQIADIQPIANLSALRKLMMAYTEVGDLSPVAELKSLMFAARPGHGITGLTYAGTPVARTEPYSTFLRLPNPARTVETINYVRRQRGLPDYIPPGYTSIVPADAPKRQLNTSELDPVENLPSAVDFKLSPSGQVVLAESPASLPVFPRPGGKKDHADRLDTCRTLAEDLRADLEAKVYQARGDYARSLKKYANRLPLGPDEGNIFLADAEARSLRNMFAADADMLSAGFASRLKTLLEQQIGLRVYYPGLGEFYRDVQSGRIEDALPLDAIDGFVQTVRDRTPELFDLPVTNALEGTAEQVKLEPKPAQREVQQSEPQPPMPPRDPLGELDPQKARDFSFAGAANALWKVVRRGEEIHKKIEAWQKITKDLSPHIRRILDWLRDFTPGDGTPPLPPTIGV